MWADGSLNKIKRVYLDPLEIEPAASPVITQPDFAKVGTEEAATEACGT